MMTFFTTAKAFQGHDSTTQQNALKSWKLLHPDVEVILFGDEEGTAEVCAELGLRHEPHVERHESGMKYLNYMFGRAQKMARHDYLCYSNCDIVLMKDFLEAFEKVKGWRDRFLLVSRRWDTNVTEAIDFDREDWPTQVRKLALSANMLQHFHFVDFFAFHRGLYDLVPPLLVGRSYWDHWLVWKALDSGVAVVDASPFMMAIHQNHGYGYHPKGKQGTDEDVLAQHNLHLAGGGAQQRSIFDATHTLGRYGRIRWSPLHRVMLSEPVQRVAQRMLIKTFWLRQRLGLRRPTLDKAMGYRVQSGEANEGDID
jgi:hypothetical protein